MSGSSLEALYHLLPSLDAGRYSQRYKVKVTKKNTVQYYFVTFEAYI
jgi:hypothetical protein